MSIGARKRFEILRRDNFTCQYCGASAPDVRLHVDHFLASAHGGSSQASNLITACVACNLGKGVMPARDEDAPTYYFLKEEVLCDMRMDAWQVGFDTAESLYGA